MSFSSFAGNEIDVPVSALMYRDVAQADVDPKPAAIAAVVRAPVAIGPSAQEIEGMLARTRAEVSTETELRMKAEFDSRLAAEAGKIGQALVRFQDERKDYFARVESDVVHLALAIAAKVLHREAQVDPMLIAALVRLAVEKLHDASSVTVKVCVGEAEKWREHMVRPSNGSSIEIVEDPNLAPGDCLLITDLGSTSFSIDAQLKEVEQGFFDLLAQRPAIK